MEEIRENKIFFEPNTTQVNDVVARFNNLTPKGREIFVDVIIERYAPLICGRLKKIAKCRCAKLEERLGKQNEVKGE